VAASTTPCPQPTPLDQSLDIFSDDGPYIGTAREGSYAITAFELGLDVLEDGHPSEIKAQWSLICTAKLAGSRTVSQHCQLDEMGILPWVAGTPYILKRSYSTSEGALQFVRADWPRGALDLRLHRDEMTTEIELRFDKADGVLRLVSLRAVEVFRSALGGTLTTREYRLPTYDTVLMVPVPLKGRFSAARKRWDSLIASLSPADQSAWKAPRWTPENRPLMDGSKPAISESGRDW
jgi:hypothetical protein